MKVVLNQDIKGVGKKLQTVEVSQGYARNFLFPKNLATPADNKSLNEAKTKIESQNFKKKVEIEEATKLKEKIEKDVLKFAIKTGENGKLFGSVTEKDIAEKIKEKYLLEINKKKIILKDHIKLIGNYEVSIKVYEGIIAKVKISVVEM